MSRHGEEPDEMEGPENFFSFTPAQPSTAPLTDGNHRPSLLGNMPPEILSNILERMNAPQLSTFSLAARWCHNHAGELIYKRINVTRRAVAYLQANPQHLPKVREVNIDCRRVLSATIQTIAFLPELPNLQTICFHNIVGPGTARILYMLLGAIEPIPTLRRIEIKIGHGYGVHGGARIRCQEDPDWDNLSMSTQPNLESLVFDFGPLAMAITRLDTLVFNVLTPNKSKIKVLEVKCVEAREPVQTVMNGLKHFIFRCANEEVNPTSSEDPEDLENIEAYQYGYMNCFATDSLEIFRFYSETGISGTREREINLDEVCRLFPNLKEIDFVTRASWQSNLKDARMDPPMTALTTFTHPGTTRTDAPFGNIARTITDSDLILRGPVATTLETDIMGLLVRNCFPNAQVFGWYHRRSNAVVDQARFVSYRIMVNIRREIWYTVHDHAVNLLNQLAKFWNGPTSFSHWWGNGEVTYYW